LATVLVVVDGLRRLVECEDASSADDATQRQVAFADRRLDGAHEAAPTRDAVRARERPHRRRRRQTHHALRQQHHTASRLPLSVNSTSSQCFSFMDHRQRLFIIIIIIIILFAQ